MANLEDIVKVLLTDVGANRAQAEKLLHTAFQNDGPQASKQLFQLASSHSDKGVWQTRFSTASTTHNSFF